MGGRGQDGEAVGPRDEGRRLRQLRQRQGQLQHPSGVLHVIQIFFCMGQNAEEDLNK